jgi:hypothetical protein
MKRLSFIPGRVLSNGEKSKTGLYGIRSTEKGIMLRISLFQEAAELMRDHSRDICEIYLE